MIVLGQTRYESVSPRQLIKQLFKQLWEINKEKTSDECCTPGEMVRGIFYTRCQIRISNHKGSERIYIDFDTSMRRFESFNSTYWPLHPSKESYHFHLIS